MSSAFNFIAELPVYALFIVLLMSGFFTSYLIYRGIFKLSQLGFSPSLKLISPTLISTLGTLFALIVGFLAAEVWSINTKAQTALANEVNALQRVLILSDELSSSQRERVRMKIKRYIDIVVRDEWPLMQSRSINSTYPDTVAKDLTGLADELQPIAFKEQALVRDLRNASLNVLDARNNRIEVSNMSVNHIKWLVVFGTGFLLLLVVAIVHIGNGASSLVAMGIINIAFALSVVLIATHSRPYSGDIALTPLQIKNLINK